MTTTSGTTQRATAVHLLRSGRTPEQVAAQLGRSRAWVYRCQQRFEQAGWAGLSDRSRAPHHQAQQLSPAVRQAIRQARSELEAQAAQEGQLRYIGGPAVQARLRAHGLTPLPSVASIERVLADAGMTRPQPPAPPVIHYPHLHPTQPHTLCQVDIVPHFLTGGQAVACFNAIDVVSHYPTGWASLTKRAADAAAFLIQVWQDLGVPHYTQLDNEACFSGGFTHPGVLGQVVRLGLAVGTELLFSPLRHPASNGTVERFHQDYNAHVWQNTTLADVAAVNQQAAWFFRAYRQSRHHTALQGQTPAEAHMALPAQRLPVNAPRSMGKLPLVAGRVHFLRRVSPVHTISVLNLTWAVPKARADQGVWATVDLTPQRTSLRVYDTAPDAPTRVCLAEHPVPISEAVQPRTGGSGTVPASASPLAWVGDLIWGALQRRAAAWLSTMC
jgi:transposase InsO family protein